MAFGTGVRPLVSVIIPCRDEARYLRDAVHSATARAVRVEIIVVDDGSTDHTAAVARSLPEVLLVRQSRRGRAAARNRGLRAASGDFVIFLDAADRLLPGAVDLAARALAGARDCAMAYGRAMTMGADGRAWPVPDEPIVRSGHHAALLQSNVVGMAGAAIFRRAAVVAAGGFGEALDDAADYDLYLRISRAHPVYDHGQVVAICRIRHGRDGSAERMLRDTLTVMLRNRPEPGSPLHRAWRDGYARWQDRYGTELAREVRRSLRARAFADAWRMSLALVRLAPRVMARELRRAAARRYRRRVIAARSVGDVGDRLGA
jgi:glycosyltransferase involved in cell wall biosynthesis